MVKLYVWDHKKILKKHNAHPHSSILSLNASKHHSNLNYFNKIYKMPKVISLLGQLRAALYYGI